MTYFLGILLALLPAYQIRFSILGIPTTALEIILLLFLLLALFKLDHEGFRKIRSLKWLNVAVGGFVLAGIISTMVSPEQIKALGELKAFIIEPVLFFYAVISLFKPKDLTTPLKFLFSSASLISLFGIIQYFTYIHLPLRFWGTGSEVERITSFFDYPNALALYLAPLLGLFLTLKVYGTEIIKKQWLFWIGIALMTIALLLTFSRGAWLALVIVLGLVLIRHFGAKKTVWPMLGIILILLGFAPVRERLLLGLSDSSSLVHSQLWTIGIHQIWSHPVFGNGLHGFSALNVSYPHNIFLNFWLEMGLLGLVSFCAILLLTFRQKKLAVTVFLTILILHGLVDVPYFKNDLSVLFWFIIAMTYL